MRTLILAFVVLVASVTSCSDDPSSDEGGSETPVATYQELGPDELPSAEVVGQVGLDGDCLYFEDPLRNRFIPVFDENATRWDADAESVTVGSVTLTDGSPVRMSGAGVRPSDRYTVPAECDPGLQKFIVDRVASPRG